MIQLPSMAGVPRSLGSSLADPLAARAALAVAGPGELRLGKRSGRPLEHAVLLQELGEWRERLARPLRIFRPRFHLMLNEAPACGCQHHDGDDAMCLWLMNANEDFFDSAWILKNRWPRFERAVPGLAATALLWIDRAAYFSIPVYTPLRALQSASCAWWRWEENESEILAEMASEEPRPDGKKVTAEDLGIPTRAWFDSLVPRAASEHEGALKGEALERAARRRDEAGELARRVQRLAFEAKALRRGRQRFLLHDEGDSEVRCFAYGACITWSANGPELRAFDDHTNDFANGGYSVECAYGWYPLAGGPDLRALFDHLERTFALARMVEEVIELIAERRRT